MNQILFVCTANQARSPFCEAVFASTNLCPDVVVASAGTQAVDGRPCDPKTTTIAQELGFEVSGHRSRRLADDHVRDSDLIVCMTNEHVRQSVGLYVQAWSRTFTLIDLARRAALFGPRSGGPVANYAAALHEGRNLQDVWLDGGPDDLPDPINLSLNGHRRILMRAQSLTESVGLLLR